MKKFTHNPWLKNAAVVLVIIPVIGLAQIPGIPQLVYDPAAVAQIIGTINSVIKVYTEATQIYNTVTSTYNQIAYNAGWTPIKTPWRGIATPIVLSNTGTIFGETGPWTAAVTAATAIPAAWGAATYGINPPAFYGGFPIGQSSISANIASINVADGMSQAAMQAISNSRGNQPLNDAALTALELSAMDTGLGTNSEVQQLNQISSGTVLSNRQQEDANALLTTIAEQQIMTNKTTRDTLATNLNVMTIRDNYVASEATAWGGDASLFASYQQ